MVPGEVDGGLEPELLAPTRQAVRTQIADRIDGLHAEWTNRRPDDAAWRSSAPTGRSPRPSTSASIGRRASSRSSTSTSPACGRLRARPAHTILGIDVAPRAPRAGGPPRGQAPSSSRAQERHRGDRDAADLPGAPRRALASVRRSTPTAGSSTDRPGDTRRRCALRAASAQLPAQLWLGIDSPVAPEVLLSVAFEVRLPAGSAAVSAVATAVPAPPPTLRWEAMTSAGATALPVERDDHRRALSQSVVLTLRRRHAGAMAEANAARPGRRPAAVRLARRGSSRTDYPDDRRLARVTLNGVPATAARSIRGEVLVPLDRRASGRSRYRLSQVPIVPGSVAHRRRRFVGGPLRHGGVRRQDLRVEGGRRSRRRGARRIAFFTARCNRRHGHVRRRPPRTRRAHGYRKRRRTRVRERGAARRGSPPQATDRLAARASRASSARRS